jgi:DNA topoisomerase-1
MMRMSHDEVMRKEGEGIVRLHANSGWEYRYLRNGKEVTKKDMKRIDGLGIPPAWREVWIAEDPEASIQAIGLDAKGRKQYRYNVVHIADAEKAKFLRLKDFIKAIPKLERALEHDSKSCKIYDRERVIVTMLTLVSKLHIRVGKEHYAKTNKSYGISSLKKKHVKISGDKILLRFKGKSNQRLSYSLADRAIRSHIRELLKLEGDKMFQYIDDSGHIRRVTDTDMNDYIKASMGEDFTVKDFRTYAANYHFLRELLKETMRRSPMSQRRIKKNIINAVKKTARYLRHTRSISKKSYIMNFAVDMYSNNPEFFIANKEEDVNKVLLSILKLYQHEVLQI